MPSHVFDPPSSKSKRHQQTSKCHQMTSKCHHLMEVGNLMMAKRRSNLTGLPLALTAASGATSWLSRNASSGLQARQRVADRGREGHPSRRSPSRGDRQAASTRCHKGASAPAVPMRWTSYPGAQRAIIDGLVQSSLVLLRRSPTCAFP